MKIPGASLLARGAVSQNATCTKPLRGRTPRLARLSGRLQSSRLRGKIVAWHSILVRVTAWPDALRTRNTNPHIKKQSSCQTKAASCKWLYRQCASGRSRRASPGSSSPAHCRYNPKDFCAVIGTCGTGTANACRPQLRPKDEVLLISKVNSASSPRAIKWGRAAKIPTDSPIASAHVMHLSGRFRVLSRNSMGGAF